MTNPEPHTRPRLLVRADEGPRIGVGHVMRCLALAQQWVATGGTVTWIGGGPNSPLAHRWQQLGATLIPAPEPHGGPDDIALCLKVAGEQTAAWIVIDGYHLGPEYQRPLTNEGWPLLHIDDHGQAGEYVADLVLDQNLGTSAALYPGRSRSTRLLLGAPYVLLRKEFLQHRTQQRVVVQAPRQLLVSLGGSDSTDVTGQIIRALVKTDLPELHTTVLIGPRHHHEPTLRKLAAPLGDQIRFLSQSDNMAARMAETDLAIAAGGTTAWELAFMQVPALLIILADNQEPNVLRLAQAGAALNLGWAHSLDPAQLAQSIIALARDPARRQAMARRGRELIDGHGAYRTWLHLAEHRVQMRRARPEDCALIWQWANEPGVRQVSFHSDPIAWETHVQWFEKNLLDPQTRIWIATRPGADDPIGQVRIEQQDQLGVIGISLSPEQRRQKLGGLLIWLACRQAFSEMSVNRVQAWIKPSNEASRRAFEKVGFHLAAQAERNGQPALVYELDAPDL